MNRLTQLPTLRINPAKTLPFTYREKKYQGMSGDTVAVALYSNGVRIFSKSTRYHRPRGLYSLDGECGNCLMEVDGLPNIQAETSLLRGGMTINPQNIKSFEKDSGPDKVDPAGFDYQKFHKPYKMWPYFLKRIRNAAGLGVVSPSFRMKGLFDEQYLNAEVCVIGGGPAGILAALAAAEQGLRVILLEARPWLGGCSDYRSAEYTPGVALYSRARELAKAVEDTPNVRVFSHTFMTGLYADNHVTAFQIGAQGDHFNERYMEIRAESVIAATGCIERPLLFENNDLPGIMQASCAHRLARTYGLLPGERAIFSVGHDLGIEAAIDLSDLGLPILCVADCRPDVQDPRLIKELTERGIPFMPGWVVSKAEGGKSLEKVTLTTIEGIRHHAVECDTLVASADLTPAAGPLFMSGAKMEYDFHTGFFLPGQLPPKVHAAGRLIGLYDPFSIEASGHLAGLNAAKDCGASVDALLKTAQKEIGRLPGPARGSKWMLPPSVSLNRDIVEKIFICLDEDTTVKHIDQAYNMGFDTVELMKRFTGAGTGPGQGGISGHNLPLVISRYHSDSVMPTLPGTVRPPLVPSFLATYSGRSRDMVKRTPLHESGKAAGALFQRERVWKHARYFSDDFTCREEIENVRGNVGVTDVSALGKFRIFGPDAVNALQRVYVGNMSDIPVGKVRYSAMCNEDGRLIDLGVVTKRGEEDYYFTTTADRADSAMEWIRYHTRYDQWNFHIVNLTDAFAAINLAGPNSRELLRKITDADISGDAFPFMACRTFALRRETSRDSETSNVSDISAIPVRVMRLGFVGELSYEIHAPASLAESLWDLLMEAGRDFGIRPFGSEALDALRLEKGHVIIGRESETRTTLHDLGLGFLWDEEHAGISTVGVPPLKFTRYQTGRLRLVGFKTEDPSRAPRDGSIIVEKTIRGYVCTARYSFTLKEAIGLALVESRLAKKGTRLQIFEDGMKKDERLYATVVSTPFLRSVDG
ncbi:FAD-dependent oxidoreductase [Desulfobacterales bacterium HSG2]|nr:FAD-dependent oxidoreductase [Desulfobacterales bacterium HSG2]